MKTSRRRGRFGWLLFVLPLAIIFGIIAYQVYAVETAPKTGTLSLITLVQPYHSAQAKQAEEVTVDGAAVEAPANLTLAPGPHVIVFPAQNGYTTPASRRIVIGAGQTSYAVGLYVPIVRFVGVQPNTFNDTSVKAVQGVTPVCFLNISNQVVTIQSLAWESSSDPQGIKPLGAGQNFTYVYLSVGTSAFWNFDNRSVSGEVFTSA